MPPKENEIEQSELFALEEQVTDLKGALYDARRQLKSAICIPENATNGDVIEATGLFEVVRNLSNDMRVCVSANGLINLMFISFDREWWNAPYKRTEG